MIKLITSRGIVLINGKARHPQSQGSVENANRGFKAVLAKKRLEYSTKEFVCFLLEIQLILNTSVNSVLPKNMTPYEVYYGRKPAFVRPLIREVYNVDTGDFHWKEVEHPIVDRHQQVDFRDDDVAHKEYIRTKAENRVFKHNEHKTAKLMKNNPPPPLFEPRALCTLLVHKR